MDGNLFYVNFGINGIHYTKVLVDSECLCFVTIGLSLFSTVDEQFTKQIAEMLVQLSYIDECNTLGQKTGRKDIHKVPN